MKTWLEAIAGKIGSQLSLSDLRCCQVGYEGVDLKQNMQEIKKTYMYGSP